MIAAIVVPLGCLSKARTAPCFVPLLVTLEGIFPGFAGFVERLLARANLAFVMVLLCGICGSFSVATAPCAVTTEAPQWQHRQRGRIPDKANGLSRHRAVTLSLPPKSTPFCEEN
jgi:hypothetical protein